MPRRKHRAATTGPNGPLYAPKRTRLLNVAARMAMATTYNHLLDPVVPNQVGCNQEEDQLCTSNDEEDSFMTDDALTEPPLANTPVTFEEESASVNSDETTDSLVGDYYQPQDQQDSVGLDYPFGPVLDASDDEEGFMVPPETAKGQNEHTGFVFGDNIAMAVELMLLCSDAQVPLHFYDKIVRLFKKYSVCGTKISTIPSCQSVMRHLKSKIPVVEPHIFAFTSTQDIVPKFSFLDQLLDLFSTKYFEDIQSCCVNQNSQEKGDIFSMYRPTPGDGLSEVVCGQW